MKWQRQLGRLRVEFFTSDMNWHGPRVGAGTDADGFETLRRGFKVVTRTTDNPVRSYWGRCFMRYHADGSWWCLTIKWLRRGEFGR